MQTASVKTSHPEQLELRDRRRELLGARLKARPIAGISSEEIQAHLDGMPKRYWETVSEAELVWSVKTVHRFLSTLVDSEITGHPVIVDWRHFPKQGFTKLMVVSWDRVGLLATACAAFSASGINICQAEVYTRADNVAVDTFRITDEKGGGTVGLARLRKMSFDLESALNEPLTMTMDWMGEKGRVIHSSFKFSYQR